MSGIYYDVEFRDDGAALSGLAVPFGKHGVIVKNGRLMRERIEPGALSWSDVILSRGHDPATAFARTPDSLVVSETREGIVFRAEPPQTQLLADARALIKQGILRGASIEFRVHGEHMEHSVRVITKGELTGISLVARGAYDAPVQARHRKRRVWL